jgi:hypothetical protein
MQLNDFSPVYRYPYVYDKRLPEFIFHYIYIYMFVKFVILYCIL